MLISEFKQRHIQKEPKTFFWRGDTMAFWGDTLENFEVITHKNGYELARKLPVKHGLQSSHWFSLEFKFMPATDDNIEKIKGTK